MTAAPHWTRGRVALHMAEANDNRAAGWRWGGLTKCLGIGTRTQTAIGAARIGKTTTKTKTATTSPKNAVAGATGSSSHNAKALAPNGAIGFARSDCRTGRAVLADNRGWRWAWSMYGPLLPLALAAGLIVGTALAFLAARGVP